MFQFDADNRENREKFRRFFIELTGHRFPKSSNDTDFNNSYTIVHPNLLNNSNIELNKSYIFHQPNGQQDYPDIVLYKITSDEIEILFIECKQRIPKFNNTPPKKNKCCIYICGNNLFNGFYLRSQENVDKFNQYVRERQELAERYNSDPEFDMRISSLRGIEFTSNWPPIYFRDKKDQSDDEIKKQIMRFID